MTDALDRAFRQLAAGAAAIKPRLRVRHERHVLHVNAVGANWASRREVAADVVLGSDLVVVDDLAQALLEAGDLLLAEGFDGESVRSLAELVTDPPEPRPPRTLFKSLGVGLEDVVAAGLVLGRAREQGMGVEV